MTRTAKRSLKSSAQAAKRAPKKATKKPAEKTALSKTALEQQQKAIGELITAAGSQKELGDALGVTQAAVSKWLVRGWLPLERAAEAEALYGIARTKVAHPRVVSLLAPSESLLQDA